MLNGRNQILYFDNSIGIIFLFVCFKCDSGTNWNSFVGKLLFARPGLHFDFVHLAQDFRSKLQSNQSINQTNQPNQPNPTNQSIKQPKKRNNKSKHKKSCKQKKMKKKEVSFADINSK